MIRKLSFKLALTYALIFIIAITAIDALLIFAYTKNQLAKTETVYHEVAGILASMAEKNVKIATLIDIHDSIYPGSQNGRILYLDKDGMVLADSINEYEGKIISNSEVNNTIKNKKAAAGYYKLNNKNMAMFTYPVQSEGKLSGIILISAYVDEIYDEIAKFTRQVIMISIVVFVFVFIISVLMGERITKPIRKLTDASKEILNGNINTTVNINRNDEIGILAKTFNLMGGELHKIDIGRKRYIGDLSHELKTPLASMKVLVESLIAGDPDAATCKEYLIDIDSEIDRLSSLVKSLITAARIEEIQPRLQQVNIHSEVDNVMRIFTPLADKRHIKLNNKCQLDTTINLDRELFRELLINLVDNGIKYGIENGFLDVKTQHPGDKTELIITDNGIGISHQDLPNIFDNFYRVDEARTRDSGGSGIGLFIVKRIAALHGWNVSVKSELDKGTQFIITL